MLTQAIHNLIPLQVVVPILGCVGLVFVRNSKLSMHITTGVLLACFTLAANITFLTIRDLTGRVYYVYGGFSRLVGIEHSINNSSALMLILSSAAAFLGYLWGRKLLVAEIDNKSVHLFNVLYLAFYSGIVGALLTNDIFNLFIFLEVLSIASYGLIALNKTTRSASFNTFNYLILGSVGISLYVLATGIIYMLTGSLNINAILPILLEHGPNTAILLALTLIIIMTQIKIGLVPFSALMPKVYSCAPFTLNPLFSGVASKVALLAIAKIILVLETGLTSAQQTAMQHVCYAIGIISMIYGSVRALAQKNIKQLLGWSSASQMGLMFMLLVGTPQMWLSAAIVFVIYHIITKTALFIVAGNLRHLTGAQPLTAHTSVLSTYSKISLFTLIVAAANLVGLPGTLGFAFKWYVITGLWSQGLYTSVAAIFVSSAIAVAYIWKLISPIVFHVSGAKPILHPSHRSLPNYMSILTISWGLILLLLGLGAPYIIPYISTIATMM